MPGEPKHEVVAPSGKFSHGMTVYEVVGKITTHRYTFAHFGLKVRNCIRFIREAKPQDLIPRIEQLEAEFENFLEEIDKILIESGDTDPRH